MKIKVLYENSDFLVIDKPSGIAVHADGRSKEKTITDWVLKNYPKLKGIGEPTTFGTLVIDRPGIVHRLDKETSGVLVIVKNKKAYEYYKKQFMERRVRKIYHAIVNGLFKNDYGVINRPIGRSPSDFRRRLAGRGARGEMKEAVTEYKVLKRFKDKKEDFSYLEVMPKTGRTHQIRVHMKYFSHPVACDQLYNSGKPCPAGFSRLALHAKSIEFKDPKGKSIKIESELPKEFQKILSTKDNK